ncbi:hypothetical protein D3C76_1255070 [compost metagenome]
MKDWGREEVPCGAVHHVNAQNGQKPLAGAESLDWPCHHGGIGQLHAHLYRFHPPTDAFEGSGGFPDGEPHLSGSVFRFCHSIELPA